MVSETLQAFVEFYSKKLSYLTNPEMKKSVKKYLNAEQIP